MESLAEASVSLIHPAISVIFPLSEFLCNAAVPFRSFSNGVASNLPAQSLWATSPGPRRVELSGSTLMKSPSCPERRILMEEYSETVLTYSALVQKCTEGSWSIDLNESFRRIEQARINCEIARLALESHIAEHQCLKRAAAAGETDA